MIKIGCKIFYEIPTGNVIINTGERQGSVVETTIEQDIATFTKLSERNRETFDVLELPFGAYQQDFAECNGYRVNVETKELEFSYPDPNQPEEPQPYRAPLSVEVEELKKDNTAIRLENAQSSAELFEMMIMMTGGGV